MMAPPDRPLTNHVRRLRMQRGWSQAELAERTGLSRSGVSAIEQGALVPSTAAALALAGALEARVEELFALAAGHAPRRAEWAWEPAGPDAPSWRATVGERTFRYPVEATMRGALAHDERDDDVPATVIVAGCDPAVGLLAAAVEREAGLRLLPFTRSSRSALQLLREGRVHFAGVHLGENAAAVRDLLGPGHALVRVATWDEGLAIAPGLDVRSVRGAVRANLRWVARQPGSGAQRTMDNLLAGVARRPRGHQRIARDHLGVAANIESGWAQVGVCVRMAAAQASLDFLPIEREALDLCTTTRQLDDPAVRAVVRALRSPYFRRQADGVPGYDVREAGSIEDVG